MKRAAQVAAVAIVAAVLLPALLPGQTPSTPPSPATSFTLSGAERAARMENDRDDQILQRVPPFKVFDNLYYVGIGWVGAWLITTDQGLILIDSLEPRYADHVIDSVRKAGFDPKNIRYLIIAQAHFDHLGAAVELQQTYGVTVGMGEADWTFAETSNRGRFKVPKRQLVIKDGDTLALGKTTLKFYTTPGHTPGTTSIDFTVYDNGQPHRAFMLGGGAPAPGVEPAEQFVATVARLETMQDGIEVRVLNHPWMDPHFWDRRDQLAARKPREPHPFVSADVVKAWIQQLKVSAAADLADARAKAASSAPKH
jgi:metallo-beta-lactamase class B